MSTLNPQISVIMPAWQSEALIARTIDSILHQTFTRWELVVVDDCSTDATAQIVSRYAAKDPRIRLAHTDAPSGSALKPRALAASLAVAPRVCAIDSDDTIAPDYLERMLARAEATGADIVMSRLQMSRDGSTIPAADFDMERIYTGAEAVELSFTLMALNGAGALIRRELYDEAARRFPDDFCGMTADELFTLKLEACAGTVAMCEALYVYHQHPESITNRFSFNQFSPLENAHLTRRHFASVIEPGAMEYTCYVMLLNAAINYLNHRRCLTADERQRARALMRRNWAEIRWAEITRFPRAKRVAFALSFPTFMALIRLYLLVRRLLGVTFAVKIKQFS
jgi:glycosyltransferase involved in cell wall biosynthesis